MPVKSTQEQFIEKAKSIHNNTYDYSLVEYVNYDTKIKIICNIHGMFETTPRIHLLSSSNCKACGRERRKKASFDKYGVSHPSKTLHVQEKRQATNQEKYGCRNPQQNKEVREKTKQTNMERFGVEFAAQNKEVCERRAQTFIKNYGGNPQQNKEVREKTKQTNLKKFGTENAMQNKEVQDKTKQTNLIRYGYATFLHSPEGQEHKKQTWITKYGVDNPRKSEEVKNKIKQTNVDRYGGNPQQNKEVQYKTKQTNLDRFGVDNPRKSKKIQQKICAKVKLTNLENIGVGYYKQLHIPYTTLVNLDNKDWLKEQYTNQLKTATQIADELGISQTCVIRYLIKHNISIRQNCWYSYKSTLWLESIMKQENIYIQHALNGGELKIPGTRYSADGYCTETNTVYEFYGDYWHGNPTVYKSKCWNKRKQKTAGELYQATLERENKIKSLGYNLITIWESDYNKSKLLTLVSN
jgi:hypothetical protein